MRNFFVLNRTSFRVKRNDCLMKKFMQINTLRQRLRCGIPHEHTHRLRGAGHAVSLKCLVGVLRVNDKVRLPGPEIETNVFYLSPDADTWIRVTWVLYSVLVSYSLVFTTSLSRHLTHFLFSVSRFKLVCSDVAVIFYVVACHICAGNERRRFIWPMAYVHITSATFIAIESNILRNYNFEKGDMPSIR